MSVYDLELQRSGHAQGGREPPEKVPKPPGKGDKRACLRR